MAQQKNQALQDVHAIATAAEFKIDKLEPNSGQYAVEVTSTSGRLLMVFDLGDESLYLGVMTLAAQPLLVADTIDGNYLVFGWR